MNIRQKMIVECKRYKPENRVGIAVVDRVLGVKTRMNANMAVVVTTSSYTREAIAVARERFWELDLKAYTDVVGWLQAATSR
ncbi:MAG TPA: restriction endonuclease, partial [Nitrospira sp.]|nr:restriction endonuclease [Nitrospira sp.]